VRLNKPFATLTGVVLAVLVGAAVVYASSQTGTGSGKATTVGIQSIPLSAVSCSGTGDLYPGGPAGPVCFTLANPNPFRVTFSSVTYLPPNTAIVANSPSCGAANVSIAPGAPATLTTPITVSGGQVTGVLTIPGVVQMATAAPDGCQGATFNIPLSLNGVQQ